MSNERKFETKFKLISFVLIKLLVRATFKRKVHEHVTFSENSGVFLFACFCLFVCLLLIFL